jgi:hypothetical protein
LKCKDYTIIPISEINQSGFSSRVAEKYLSDETFRVMAINPTNGKVFMFYAISESKPILYPIDANNNIFAIECDSRLNPSPMNPTPDDSKLESSTPDDSKLESSGVDKYTYVDGKLKTDNGPILFVCQCDENGIQIKHIFVVAISPPDPIKLSFSSLQKKIEKDRAKQVAKLPGNLLNTKQVSGNDESKILHFIPALHFCGIYSPSKFGIGLRELLPEGLVFSSRESKNPNNISGDPSDVNEVYYIYSWKTGNKIKTIPHLTDLFDASHSMYLNTYVKSVFLNNKDGQSYPILTNLETGKYIDFSEFSNLFGGYNVSFYESIPSKEEPSRLFFCGVRNSRSRKSLNMYSILGLIEGDEKKVLYKIPFPGDESNPSTIPITDPLIRGKYIIYSMHYGRPVSEKIAVYCRLSTWNAKMQNRSDDVKRITIIKSDGPKIEFINDVWIIIYDDRRLKMQLYNCQENQLTQEFNYFDHTIFSNNSIIVTSGLPEGRALDPNALFIEDPDVQDEDDEFPDRLSSTFKERDTEELKIEQKVQFFSFTDSMDEISPSEFHSRKEISPSELHSRKEISEISPSVTMYNLNPQLFHGSLLEAPASRIISWKTPPHYIFNNSTINLFNPPIVTSETRSDNLTHEQRPVDTQYIKDGKTRFYLNIFR